MKKVICGLHVVKMALKLNPDNVAALYVQEGRKDQRMQEVLSLAGPHAISVEKVSTQELESHVPGLNHQGVVAILKSNTAKPTDLMSFLDGLEGPPFLLILDDVTDPHNLGACLRTADAAGVHAVIVPKDNSVGITPVVSKVSSGASETVPFFQVTNLARTIDQLKERNIWVMGAAGEAEQSVYQANLTGRLALVLGSEGSGMRRLTRESCDLLISIPMQGQVESLNVSVAAGVLLYEALRQRALKP